MDLNYLLLWMVGFYAASALFQTFRMGISGLASRKIAAGLLLAVLAVGIFAAPHIAGYVAGACWFVLFVVPSLAVRRLNRLVAGENFESAASTARWMAWLYPFDDWRARFSIYTAQGLAKSGSLDAAAKILEQYRDVKTPRARAAVAQIYKMQNRWSDFLAWIDEEIPPIEVERDPTLCLLRLRAWGETGQLDRLLAGFQAFDKRFHQIPSYRDTARLYVLTFFGKTDLLVSLFDGPMRSYAPAIRERWLAAARKAQARLVTPPVDAERADALFKGLEGELAHEKRYGAAPSSSARPMLTYLFIAINVLVFIAETLLGGATDDATLIRLGALLPAQFTPAQSWRLVAASFLHAGLLHLTMNMLALVALGPFVERILRGWRFAVCYLGAGIGAMAVVLLMHRLGFLDYDLIVGASGSIMGLVGATVAISMRDWRILKTRASVRRLRWAASVIVLQFVFDASTPQVSMTAHLGGAVSGFLLALGIEQMTRREKGSPVGSDINAQS